MTHLSRRPLLVNVEDIRCCFMKGGYLSKELFVLLARLILKPDSESQSKDLKVTSLVIPPFGLKVNLPSKNLNYQS